jgi:hypothetical protein
VDYVYLWVDGIHDRLRDTVGVRLGQHRDQLA